MALRQIAILETGKRVPDMAAKRIVDAVTRESLGEIRRQGCSATYRLFRETGEAVGPADTLLSVQYRARIIFS